MAKKSEQPAASRETANTGFLAEEEHLDRAALLRLGTWGVASVAAVIVAVLASQSSMKLRRDQVAAADLARQSQQIQLVAKESENEARRLASAIETLNGDRDRLFSRMSVLEQGLDSVTGSIARQSVAAAAPQAAPSLAPTPPPQPVAQNPAPVAPPAPAPVAAPVATATAATAENPKAEAKSPDPAPAPKAVAVAAPVKSALTGSASHGAADGVEIDDGPAGCRGRKTDRTRAACEARRRGADGCAVAGGGCVCTGVDGSAGAGRGRVDAHDGSACADGRCVGVAG